jgi:hypothetical protein
LPVELDGVVAPLEIVPALTRGRPDFIVESSACTEREACRADARSRGIEHLLQVRLQRLADTVVIAATLLSLDDSVIAEATDLAPPLAVAVAGGAVVDRLAGRAVRARRAALDRDGDGVSNDQDRCPAVAAPTSDGCPVIAVASTETPRADAVRPDPVVEPDTGPEWGRITGGAAASFFGTLIGNAVGLGGAWLIVVQLQSQNLVEFSDAGLAIVSGTGGGLGALIGSLTLDVASAGLCQYPLAASGWTRFVAVTTATAAAGAGSAIGAVGLREGLNTNQDLTTVPNLQLGAALVAAAPILSSIEVGVGNCISGPP